MNNQVKTVVYELDKIYTLHRAYLPLFNDSGGTIVHLEGEGVIINPDFDIRAALFWLKKGHNEDLEQVKECYTQSVSLLLEMAEEVNLSASYDLTDVSAVELRAFLRKFVSAILDKILENMNEINDYTKSLEEIKQVLTNEKSSDLEVQEALDVFVCRMEDIKDLDIGQDQLNPFLHSLSSKNLDKNKTAAMRINTMVESMWEQLKKRVYISKGKTMVESPGGNVLALNECCILKNEKFQYVVPWSRVLNENEVDEYVGKIEDIEKKIEERTSVSITKRAKTVEKKVKKLAEVLNMCEGVLQKIINTESGKAKQHLKQIQNYVLNMKSDLEQLANLHDIKLGKEGDKSSVGEWEGKKRGKKASFALELVGRA